MSQGAKRAAKLSRMTRGELKTKGELKLRGAGSAGTWPPATECDAHISRDGGVLSSANMLAWSASNASLLSYLYEMGGEDDVRSHWRAMTPG